MTFVPLDPLSEVVDERRKFMPDWYSWLVQLTSLTLPEATTVAGLPSATTAGTRRFVIDATATTFLSVVVGGGANKVPVVSDGTNWLIG